MTFSGCMIQGAATNKGWWRRWLRRILVVRLPVGFFNWRITVGAAVAFQRWQEGRLQARPAGGLRLTKVCAMTGFAVIFCGCAHFHPKPISAEQTQEDFGSRSLSDPGLAKFMASNHEAANPAAWDLKTLTLVAFYYRPALAEARAQLLASQAAAITAGQRPNPGVTV